MNYGSDEAWWELPLAEDEYTDSKVHSRLFSHVRSVEERQYAIHRQNLINAKLYSNRELQTLDWTSHTFAEKSYEPVSCSMENLTASVVDTLTAFIGRNMPKATPVVKDADFSIELQARQLDKYLYGEALHQNLFRKMMKVFNDACWAQVAALRIDIDGDSIITERVNPDEIIVDQRECLLDSQPLQLHHRRVVAKSVLASLYPEARQKIYEAATPYTSYRSPGTDYVIVVESWKLPSGDSDGRHAICIENCTLVDEEYTRDKFPFVFMRWSELPSGFYGKSLVEEVMPYQLRLNEINRTIKLCQDLMAVPRIFVDSATKLVKTQLDNEIARVIQFRGREPIVHHWQAVNPELYAERDRVTAAAFERVGLSQLSAQAKLPDNARLDSSKALREYSFRENERFARQAIMYEQAFIEAYEHIIELSAMLHKKGVNRKVTFHNRTLIEEIDWEAVNLDRDRFVLQIEASSVMNMTPAAREDIINNWAMNGIIDVQKYKSLLGHPDIEEETSLMQASLDDIKATIEELDKGEYPQPDELQNLELGIPYVHMTYLKRKRQKAPEDILQGYRDYLAEMKALYEAQQSRTGMAANPLAPTNVTPEGMIAPGVAVTDQGVPAVNAF